MGCCVYTDSEVKLEAVTFKSGIKKEKNWDFFYFCPCRTHFNLLNELQDYVIAIKYSHFNC